MGAHSKLDSTAPVTRTNDESETLEEAIAVALDEIDDGGIVAIHEAECHVEDDGQTGCDCDVLEIRKGAKA